MSWQSVVAYLEKESKEQSFTKRINKLFVFIAGCVHRPRELREAVVAGYRRGGPRQLPALGLRRERVRVLRGLQRARRPHVLVPGQGGLPGRPGAYQSRIWLG